ncbi:MAG: DMT family transporter [Aquabacterium sp.]|jgi:drug/metabolite transporter (DMT)-like permease|uniref:DMT family transporter n=1 Tax=Aquabacterium sp. TaxID=1872578 RepID=UPI001B5E9B61|nr:DMT family transporter [Aquabacterium sp.]MBP9062635.1 DMT family transporter [Aquabacterium sp.]
MIFRDMLAMLALAAVWGGSFLFLHVAAPLVGPVGLAAFRVGSASLVLLPIVLLKGEGHLLRTHARPLLVCGMLAFGFPFVCLSLATQHLPAGLMSILNATTPMWGAFVGWVWLRERMHLMRSLGLILGLTGVALLTADKGAIPAGANGLWAVALMLATTLSYAVAVHVARRHLHTLSPLSSATGTLCMTTLVMLIPAWWLGPQPMPPHTLQHWHEVPASAWVALLILGIVCTGLAQIVFFRLIERIGPSQALTVTFLIPVFGMLWGTLFLNERITSWMLLSTGIIALGTWLSNRPATSPSPAPAYPSKRP